MKSGTPQSEIPKVGKSSEAVFIPKNLADRLKDYVRTKGIEGDQATSEFWKMKRFQPCSPPRSPCITGLMDVLAAARLLDALPREICPIGIQPQSWILA